MTALLLALIALTLLPFLAKIPVAWAMQRQGGYDNHLPRQQQAKLDEFGQRATAAHYNSFEALQLYLAALAACIMTQQYDVLMQQLAWLFVLCRCLFILCYLFDKALLRSIIWSLGTLCIATMLLRALWSV